MKTLKILSGIFTPAPGSGIMKQVSEIKKSHDKWKWLKLVPYIAGALLLWYLIYKGIISSLDEVFLFLEKFFALV